MNMPKHKAMTAGINLKEFFEASIDSLQDDSEGLETCQRVKRRNRPLIQRKQTVESPRQTVAVAARALTALWGLQIPTRAV
jgi:hypothetical protein